MIVVTNKFLPRFKKRRLLDPTGKEDKAIATSPLGDYALYDTQPRKRTNQAYFSKNPDYDNGVDVDDNDDSDYDDSDFDEYDDDLFLNGKPVRTLSGANWQPHFTDRMTMFIAGAPGAGKSYLAKQMINLFPNNIPVLLFTALEENDGNFDELGKNRIFKIKMQPDVLKQISLSGIRERVQASNAILLFDDVDKIRDKRVEKLIFALMNDALANGRGHEKHDGKGDIHVICTSHSANDYQKTKYTFENSNYVALFPGSTPALQLQRMFDKLGLDKRICMKMMKLGRTQKIRSVIIHKVVPMYMIFGNKIMLL